MDNTITFIKIIELLYRKRRSLFVIAILAIVISTITAYTIRPKYKSEAVIYPSNISPYSQESQTEQLAQLLQSDFIMNRIISEFKLARVFKIDTTKKGSKAALILEYESNVIIDRTEFESVKLTVYHFDPDTAALIANRIIEISNEKIRSLQRSQTMELVVMQRNIYLEKKIILDSLIKIRHEMRVKNHMLDYNIQIREAYRGLFNGLNNGNARGVAEAKEVIKNLEEQGEAWDDLNVELGRIRNLVQGARSYYDQAVIDTKKVLTYANVVVKPYANDKKASPIRWLIVLSSLISAIVFGMVVFIFMEHNPFKGAKLE
jgi:uncharacterized protein involved in exopolysaccharide biosynthesis